MAKSSAQRQAEYRARRAFAGSDGNGERRINTWVSTACALGLERLARRYSVTQREMLERLIVAADEEIISSLNIDSEKWRDYFNVTR
ncbi:hypothetical protein DNK10_06600 [Pseudomonas daroniae]|nr:hypothetical protein DNK10_06600 [Pseudomonas daroniae]